MPTIPGGEIIGGMGGKIFVGPLGTDQNHIEDVPDSIDVARWQIMREWINADCTHTGTYGAITRRNVAFDWRFSASLPYDQSNPPDHLLGHLPSGGAEWVNVALAFYLGNVQQNPEAVAMQMDQKFYFAPAAIIRSAQPVLDARGDVIRIDVTGEGNSRMYLIPDEQTDCNAYISYLTSQGWWA